MMNYTEKLIKRNETIRKLKEILGDKFTVSKLDDREGYPGIQIWQDKNSFTFHPSYELEAFVTAWNIEGAVREKYESGGLKECIPC